MYCCSREHRCLEQHDSQLFPGTKCLISEGDLKKLLGGGAAPTGAVSILAADGAVAPGAGLAEHSKRERDEGPI